MPKWLKKSLVVMISVLSFGLISPPQTLLIDKISSDKTLERETFDREIFETAVVEPTLTEQLKEDSSEELEKDQPSNLHGMVQSLMKGAEEQSFMKFGQKITPKIETEFRGVILPNIEKAIANVAEQYPDEALIHLAITEVPGKGRSEKIFNIMDQTTGTDVIRFHVRLDHPPQQGHWFNFHYHTHHDQFQAHHDLGSIYWAKNTPPKWMS